MRIHYVSHVSWGWIKQRPHFISEELARLHKGVIYWSVKQRTVKTTRDSPAHLTVRSLRSLPLRRFRLVRILNTALHLLQLLLASDRGDAMIFTFPSYARVARALRICGRNVYYDCMDDSAAFVGDERERQHVVAAEAMLLKCSNHTFASSAHLLSVISRRHNAHALPMSMVRNGAISADVDAPHMSANSSTVTMTYVGTVSHWFDWNVLFECLYRHKELVVRVYGPVEHEIPKVPLELVARVSLGGVLSRENVPQKLREADILVMPFIVNELVCSVDPVKLYEYVAAFRPILAPRYPEIERFAMFADFYDDADSFANAVREMLQSRCRPKYSREGAARFLRESLWSARAAKIYPILMGER